MRTVEKRLREQIKVLNELRAKDAEKIAEFQRHYAGRFRWWIELLGQGRTPSLPWLIENDAKLMAKVGAWWWS
jgi:hypothetical protein